MIGKTAYVLAHKLREALAAEQTKGTLSGTVEADGAYFGGHTRQENEKADRQGRRLPENQSGKRQSVVVARERGGRTLADYGVEVAHVGGDGREPRPERVRLPGQFGAALREGG